MVIDLVKCVGQIYGTKIRCTATFGKAFYNITDSTNSKVASRSTFLNPNWLSAVSKKDPKRSKIQCSKTFDRIRLIAIPIKPSQVLLNLFGNLPTNQTRRRIFTHDGSNDADWRIAPHLVSQTPQKNNFWMWIGVFKPNSQNRKACILSILLHRFQPNFAQW